MLLYLFDGANIIVSVGMVSAEQILDLFCRGQRSTDRNIVVEGVDDGSDVFAHISL